MYITELEIRMHNRRLGENEEQNSFVNVHCEGCWSMQKESYQ